MFGGVGCDMIGNLFGNISKGNVSGMSIVGLVAAAFMVFGRFGWMSKIAGALLGAMIIGTILRWRKLCLTEAVRLHMGRT